PPPRRPGSTTRAPGPAATGPPVAPSPDDELELLDFDPEPKVRFEGDGKFDKVLVVDEGTERHLRFGSAQAVNQSTISLASPDTVSLEYIRAAFLSVLFAKQRRRALMVGLGGGTFTTLLRRHFPELWIDVAEIDPMVKKVAIEYFGVREDERYRIHIGDGAEFVRQTRQSYDISLIDAYEGDDIPDQLQRPEFFRALHGKTAADGVAVLNLSVSKRLERVLEARFRNAFGAVMCVRTRWGGLVLFGRPEGEMPTIAEVRVRAEQEAQHLRPSFDLVATAKKLRGSCR
ncbi:MAG: fused MFS/spermidine synthase, partial [Deltaproteobacteria bacterium]|nr:fused MFS/spermidine synthase [Deltaproteobacteria bacterium]MBW2536521.1 fused MFS/spermidine synthase [Deltaproteobacteria bacterium]